MEIEPDDHASRFSSNEIYIVVITLLLVAGSCLFVWREDLQTALADATVESAPMEITGTWVANNVPHQVHRGGVEYFSTGTHFEGPTELVPRVGNWRFELIETDEHILAGKGSWDVVNPDGSGKHVGEGHISGVVMDSHWVHEEAVHIIFIMEVPGHMHGGEVFRPDYIVRFSFKERDGRLVGYGMGSGEGMFASVMELEKVSD